MYQIGESNRIEKNRFGSENRIETFLPELEALLRFTNRPFGHQRRPRNVSYRRRRGGQRETVEAIYRITQGDDVTHVVRICLSNRITLLALPATSAVCTSHIILDSGTFRISLLLFSGLRRFVYLVWRGRYARRS